MWKAMVLFLRFFLANLITGKGFNTALHAKQILRENIFSDVVVVSVPEHKTICNFSPIKTSLLVCLLGAATLTTLQQLLW